jgi:hypothetical protein
MRVRVGHISAHCGACGGEDFQPFPADADAAHELVCFSCGAHIARRALLMQITDETVRRAKAFLERSRRYRGHSGSQ